jgi:hypothetical protein
LHKLNRFSISIMKTLSFQKRVYRATSWVAGGFRSAWRIQRFYFFPTEENLLISLWVDHAHYRRVVPKNTVYDFLDSRVRIMADSIINPDGRRSVRRLERSLLKALYREPVRKIVVDFLESPSPEENYRPVMEAIRSAWRMENEVGAGTGAEVRMTEVGGGVAGEVLEDSQEIGTAAREVGVAEKRAEDDQDSHEMGQLLNARAYIIAARLWFELEGKESEFETLSRRLGDLRSFIREKFGVQRLPGRLEEFKGYSYKSELNGRNSAKRGQLRTPFRQIMEHPEIFGEDLSARARAVLKQYFPER